jgi:valyl-tRNA synthetase
MAEVKGNTIMLQPYPASDPSLVDKAAERDIEWLKTVIVGIRSLRAEMNISPATQLPVILAKGTQDDRSRLLNSRQLLCKLGQLESIEWLGEGQKMPLSMTALAGDLEILVPLAGHINISDELDRLDREIAKLNLECNKLDAKLDKPAFIEKAPPEVVAKERQKLANLRGANRQLQQRRSEVAGLSGA